MDAAYYIKKYKMINHEEGGYFSLPVKSDFTIEKKALGPNYKGDRQSASVIYYLLEKGDRSAWHRLRSCEFWFYHAGGSLEMTIKKDWEDPEEKRILSSQGGNFFLEVPANYWQTSKLIEGDFILVSCVVSPAYDDLEFELFGGEDGII